MEALKVVCGAARRGAASVRAGAQVARAAEEETLLRYENAILFKKPIARLEAWAFRVAANAAKRLGRRSHPVSLDSLAQESATTRIPPQEPSPIESAKPAR